MSEVGWDETTYLRKRPPKATEMRSQQAVQAARREGKAVDTSKKFSAGQNRQHSSSKDSAKLDRETEELHHERVSLDVGKLIQKGRMEKKMSQKDLATKINEKPSVINDYEAGRAIPNNQIMGKIERALGIKLRGKEKGRPLATKK
ncbi:endothelial differentiation-related factor 1 homolog [Xenia sp. Carnegie-2017]|uniref:endothelial differentiation-related factor 1 homolog n=1 Tax=Xenia sp. Carnegie-2017 TaxID=2897299 RepID=UPI001F03C777|nr:endothelial differentiation-related factor 1 homolog [Xenia sp. Carnegie-2017]